MASGIWLKPRLTGFLFLLSGLWRALLLSLRFLQRSPCARIFRCAAQFVSSASIGASSASDFSKIFLQCLQPSLPARYARRRLAPAAHRPPSPKQLMSAEVRCSCSAAYFLVVPVAPEDGGAAFRRNDGVPGILQHRHLIADANAKCAAARPFANDDADDRNRQVNHLKQIARDGLTLSALFCFQGRETRPAYL